jgi:copper chaperone
METVRMQISGMSCGHCVHSVKQALAAVPGVTVNNVEIGSATVQVDPAQVPLQALKDAVEDQGYEVVEAA